MLVRYSALQTLLLLAVVIRNQTMFEPVGYWAFLLMFQVDRISDTLQNLEAHYAELEKRHSDLQEEKGSVLDEVIKLQEHNS